MTGLWIGLFVVVLLGVLSAGVWWALGRRAVAQVEVVPVEVDEVALLKDRVQSLRELEEDLISAGQALGRVRRFLVDPEEAVPLVDELRDRLADIWLRRFDDEGRLRLAALRRRVPAPPAVEHIDDDMNAEVAEEQAIALRELAESFRDLARRAEDSARMFRRLNPAEDPHARWVGDAIEVAGEWRTAQTEEIQRFAARIAAHADRLDEAAVILSDSVAHCLLDGGPGAILAERRVVNVGLRERVHGLARVGLSERSAREIDPSAPADADELQAVRDARRVIEAVRAMARRAGATRSHRASSSAPSTENALLTDEA